MATGALPSLALRSYSREGARHRHDWHQVVLPIEGALALRIGSRDHRVDRTRGVLVAEGESHAYEGVGENRFLVLDVAASSLEEAEMARDGLDGVGPAWYFPIETAIEHLIRALVPVLERPASSRTSLVHHHGAGLLLLALAELRGHTAQHTPERLQRAIDFIHEHFTRPIEVAHIASAASLSARQVHTLFKAFYGVTPMDYVADRRLDSALRLLAEERPTIAEIAFRCGYSDQASLTRAMRARRGVTPGAVRRATLSSRLAAPRSKTKTR